MPSSFKGWLWFGAAVVVVNVVSAYTGIGQKAYDFVVGILPERKA